MKCPFFFFYGTLAAILILPVTGNHIDIVQGVPGRKCKHGNPWADQCVHINEKNCPIPPDQMGSVQLTPEQLANEFKPNCDRKCINQTIAGVRMSDAWWGIKTTRCKSYKDDECQELLVDTGDTPVADLAFAIRKARAIGDRSWEKCHDMGEGKSFRCYHGC